MAVTVEVPNELRQRAIKLDVDAVAENDESLSGACGRIGPQLGINADTLRGWMKQVQIDQNVRAGVTTSERQRLQILEREVRDLGRANADLEDGVGFLRVNAKMRGVRRAPLVSSLPRPVVGGMSSMCVSAGRLAGEAAWPE